MFVRLCQKAYNMRQDVVIIYVDRRLQNASYYKMSRSPLLQNAAIPIPKCADNYKIPKTLLQNTWVITKCVVMKKCRRTLPSHLNSLQFLSGKSLGVFLFKTSLNLQQESRHQNSLSFTLRMEYLEVGISVDLSACKSSHWSNRCNVNIGIGEQKQIHSHAICNTVFGKFLIKGILRCKYCL